MSSSVVVGPLVIGSCLLLGVAPAAADILIVVDEAAQRMSVSRASADGARRYVWKVPSEFHEPRVDPRSD
jgi:hypothetical protein